MVSCRAHEIFVVLPHTHGIVMARPHTKGIVVFGTHAGIVVVWQHEWDHLQSVTQKESRLSCRAQGHRSSLVTHKESRLVCHTHGLVCVLLHTGNRCCSPSQEGSVLSGHTKCVVWGLPHTRHHCGSVTHNMITAVLAHTRNCCCSFTHNALLVL